MRAWMLGSLILVASSGEAMAQDGPPEGPPPGEGRPVGPPPDGAGRGGPLFISPMGEPFRGDPGTPPPHEAWFDGADTDHDGALSEEEMVADAARFFAVLDQRKDGEIDPDDIERYETILAPEIRTGGGGGGPRFGGRGLGGPGGGPGGPGGEGRGPEGMAAPRGGERAAGTRQGAARFGYLDYPEPVTVADRNLNRGIDHTEFASAASARFAMLDANHDGKIERSELPRLRPFGGRPPRDGGRRARTEIPED
ncbi:EF-hand domain-containing protein [Sphingomonas psychrotolerans]|uniref:EF-hand domain-containing protein n=1 Tax=Sphingomonas psychrotolerans TaxID=1327635 RepID=A0ABU3N601_9SPHN|nr:EF-hand domain-containing protein [Sphingomonas psychrotolerans]MDT8759922.1 EF-hand domain-containing protein [Sphingomonas psychrotolerans]